VENLYIVSNEKISFNNSVYYSANKDFQTITEGLKNYFNVNLIARKSLEKQNFKINYSNIYPARTFLHYMLSIIFCSKNKNKYLIISITPYTFFAYLIILLFSDNIYLYLRSDGFKEYESILGKKWVFLYQIMFYFFIKKSKIISCDKNIYKGKIHKLLKPSELDKNWFKNRRVVLPKKKVKLLYVGRIRVEKGIFYFLNFFSKLGNNFILTIIGDKKINLKKKKRIRFFYFYKNDKNLIKRFDINDIIILPSYTEAYPKVVDEALSRYKPVIVFKDIKHVVRKKFGIFVVDRNINKFIMKINYITDNYKEISKKISKNILPTKKKFIFELVSALKKN
jgi:glycosyltransferase involved in cell wall biosynthesis